MSFILRLIAAIEQIRYAKGLECLSWVRECCLAANASRHLVSLQSLRPVVTIIPICALAFRSAELVVLQLQLRMHNDEAITETNDGRIAS